MAATEIYSLFTINKSGGQIYDKEMPIDIEGLGPWPAATTSARGRRQPLRRLGTLERGWSPLVAGPAPNSI
ncbi:hypothetical protein CRG98_035984 [Punica granatum]|uniref:Uncharacterized protein n=1 Tax=Punica granatum TaxID=22663 RepID=A0A2I0IHY8_PUNGR|nr:hypothetical protein CRG98_035984 [Punica granatum]